MFQTLIVTWIKANLNVAVKPELWQSFMELLTRLTHWEDLIKEWAVRKEIGLKCANLPYDTQGLSYERLG